MYINLSVKPNLKLNTTNSINQSINQSNFYPYQVKTEMSSQLSFAVKNNAISKINFTSKDANIESEAEKIVENMDTPAYLKKILLNPNDKEVKELQKKLLTNHKLMVAVADKIKNRLESNPQNVLAIEDVNILENVLDENVEKHKKEQLNFRDCNSLTTKYNLSFKGNMEKLEKKMYPFAKTEDEFDIKMQERLSSSRATQSRLITLIAEKTNRKREEIEEEVSNFPATDCSNWDRSGTREKIKELRGTKANKAQSKQIVKTVGSLAGAFAYGAFVVLTGGGALAMLPAALGAVAGSVAASDTDPDRCYEEASRLENCLNNWNDSHTKMINDKHNDLLRLAFKVKDNNLEKLKNNLEDKSNDGLLRLLSVSAGGVASSIASEGNPVTIVASGHSVIKAVGALFPAPKKEAEAKELIYNDFNERVKVALITYKLKQLIDNSDLDVKELKKELTLSIY